MQLDNKITIITGSAQGLGRVFAQRLLEEGAKVCISDVNEKNGVKAATELADKFGKHKVHFIKCDVTKESELKELYDGTEEYFKDKVDIFCNNAGINHVPGWRLCMEIDIMAVMTGTELAMDRMDISKGGKGGLIVNTASLAGITPGMSKESACYFVAKHGVVALTRTLGTKKILKESGVKVQCICPAFAETAIIGNLGPGVKAGIKKKFGIMTPEFVGDAFVKLIKRGDNGAALAVVKDSPPIFFPEHSVQLVLFLAFGAKVMHKLFGIEVFTAKHQLAYLAFIVILLNLILSYIFFA